MEFIEHWHSWLVIAFIILIVELMTGTFFLLAVAGGAFLTSLVTWLTAPTITMQLLSFAVTSAITYMILLSFRQEKEDVRTDGTNHMLGQQVKVTEEVNHHGRVEYKGVSWQAKSDENIKAGDYAEITEVNGSTLTVKAIHKEEK